MDWSKLVLPATIILNGLWNSAFAYTVEKHGGLTQIAVDKFNSCIEQNEELRRFQPIDEKIGRQLIEKNLFEDLMDVGDRLRHWHFWDPTRKGEKAKVFHKHFHKRFDYVAERATNPSVPVSSVYNNVGHMFHYFQDVSVPAHVVPVFHPAPPLFKKDSFDDYDVDFYEIQEKDLTGCIDLATGLSGLGYEELLNQVANETLRRIKEIIPIEGNKTQTWEGFWHKPKPKKRFGKYGKFGNKFGRDVEFDCGNKTCRITKEHYDSFSLRQHRLAVDATVRALFLTQEILAAREN